MVNPPKSNDELLAKGYVAIPRSLWDSSCAVTADELLIFVFTFLCWRAVFKCQTINLSGMLIELQPGQLVTTRDNLHEDLYVRQLVPKSKRRSPSTVWRAVEKLEKEQFISTRNLNNRATLITVLHLEAYAANQPQAPPDVNNRLNGELNSRRTTDEQPVNTQIKGSKKKYQVVNEETSSEASSSHVFTTREGTEWRASDKQIEDLRRLFPDVDLDRELGEFSKETLRSPKRRRKAEKMMTGLIEWLQGKFDPLAPELPEALQTDRFREAWSSWVSHRRDKNASFTKTSTLQQLAELAEWGEETAVREIFRAIKRGWKSIHRAEEPAEQAGPRVMSLDEVNQFHDYNPSSENGRG